MTSLRGEIAEMEQQIQLAGETRQKENVKFQTEASALPSERFPFLYVSSFFVHIISGF